MRLTRHSNLFAVFVALGFCYGCGIRSALFVGDAGVDSSAGQGQAGSEGTGSAGGAAPELLCGNAVIDEREQCDGDNLGGETCASLGEGGGALRCGPACLFDVSMCAPRYPVPTGEYGGTAAPVLPPTGPRPFDGGIVDASGLINDTINSFTDGVSIYGGRAGGDLSGRGNRNGGNRYKGNPDGGLYASLREPYSQTGSVLQYDCTFT